MAEIKDELAKKVTRELLNQGKIIASGWSLFCSRVMPKDAPKIQVEEMEKAFFAGAQHLWGSLMTGLDGGAELTANDELRMELISAELNAFYERLKAGIE